MPRSVNRACVTHGFALVQLALVTACGATPPSETVIALSPAPSHDVAVAPPSADPSAASAAKPEAPRAGTDGSQMSERERVAFATYLVGMHNRIHPYFADRFLASLDSLPASDPLNVPDLASRVEIVLDGATGAIDRIGITKQSGTTAFEVGVMAAIEDALPFAPAPKEIWSYDGKVYMDWSFHRDPKMACSLMETRPTILAKP